MRQRNVPEPLEVINHFNAGEMVEGLEKLDKQHRVWGSRIGTDTCDCEAPGNTAVLKFL